MRQRVVLPPPQKQRGMPVRIAPIPVQPAKPKTGGFFHGLHIVWVIVIGILVWQNVSQANDIKKLKQQLELHREAILESSKWMSEAESWLHKHQ